jgi:putative peptide zinc metalloprotease protein
LITTAQTRIRLHPLVMTEEAEGSWIVGREDTGQFAEIPAEGVTFLRALQRGEPVHGAAAAVLAEHGEEVDADDFVDVLADLGFVAAVDGAPTGPPRREQSLRWLRPRHVRWVFRCPALACLTTFVVACAILAGLHHDLLPSYHAFFITPAPSLTVALNAAMLLAALGLHEFWHLAAARAEGVYARIGLGTRLQFLVAQTTVSGLWAAPRRVRIRVYLAGPAADLVLIAGCYLGLSLTAPGGFGHRTLAAFSLGLWLGIAYEFAIYMRTDIYFVVQELLKCKNLYADAADHLRYAAARVLRRAPRADPRLKLPAHERGPVRLYSGLMLAGTVVSLAIFACYEAPIAVGLFIDGVRQFGHGVSTGNAVWTGDGVLALIMISVPEVLFARLFWRKHRAKIRRALGRVTPYLIGAASSGPGGHLR